MNDHENMLVYILPKFGIRSTGLALAVDTGTTVLVVVWALGFESNMFPYILLMSATTGLTDTGLTVTGLTITELVTTGLVVWALGVDAGITGLVVWALGVKKNWILYLLFQ